MEKGVFEVMECELRLENICGVSEEESIRELMPGVGVLHRREAVGADSLLEKFTLKSSALFCGRDGFLERGLGEGWVGVKGDEVICFAWSERKSNKRDAEKKLFKTRAG